MLIRCRYILWFSQKLLSLARKWGATVLVKHIARQQDTLSGIVNLEKLRYRKGSNKIRNNVVEHVLYPSLKDTDCFTISLILGFPEPTIRIWRKLDDVLLFLSAALTQSSKHANDYIWHDLELP